MADTELRLSLDEEPSSPFMAEDEEMAESSSGEPHKDLHHLSLTFPPFEISAVLDQTSNATALPRDFDMNKEPIAGDPPVEATTATRRSSGCSGVSGEQVAESEVSSQRASEMEKWSTRKKLRLSIEQSALLEECFKHHNILDPKQKLSLAEQLNLSPRQVEVWFQNRRARTKQKQTEAEYSQLKLYCKALKEENRRLAKELTELHASSMHVPPTTLTLRHSCGRRAGDATTSATTTATAHSTLAVAAAAGGNRQPRSIAALFSDPVGVYSFTKQSQNLPRQPPRT